MLFADGATAMVASGCWLLGAGLIIIGLLVMLDRRR